MKPDKLVFVDDDPDDREMIEYGLKALHLYNFIVLDGAASLYTYLFNLSEGDLPEAIVLDITMPKLSGIDILKELKSTDIYQQIPVYIFTCAEKPALKLQCITEGVAGYYNKPNNLKELEVLLNDIYTSV